MRPVFDSHVHYLFRIPLDETVELLRKEFEGTGTAKYVFLSVPQEYTDAGVREDKPLQNLKGLYLKKVFSPGAYAFAGLEHPDDWSDPARVAKDFLEQAEKYERMGFDGMKMLEGYPTFRKYVGVPLDSEIFDPFYSFCESRAFPVTLHVANPDENWDIAKARPEAIAAGRVYDGSYVSKEEQTAEVFRLLEKHPRLRLTLAHCGFFCHSVETAERFLSYGETSLDVTPGGEQLLAMAKDWDKWGAFFERYADRILYGTDFYAFPRHDEEQWRVAYTRRPFFLRRFFETDGEYEYLGEAFRGVALDETVLRKIYFDNSEKRLGTPRPVPADVVAEECRLVDAGTLQADDQRDLGIIQKAFER